VCWAAALQVWAWAVAIELGVCWPILIGVSGLLLHDFASEEEQAEAHTLACDMRRLEESKRREREQAEGGEAPVPERRDNPFYSSRDNIEEGAGGREEVELQASTSAEENGDVFDRACQ
jgi:hypothetical protein